MNDNNDTPMTTKTAWLNRSRMTRLTATASAVRVVDHAGRGRGRVAGTAAIGRERGALQHVQQDLPHPWSHRVALLPDAVVVPRLDQPLAVVADQVQGGVADA